MINLVSTENKLTVYLRYHQREGINHDTMEKGLL